MNIYTLTQKIALQLNINENILLEIIKSNLSDTQLNIEITDQELINKINNLLTADMEIQNIETQFKEKETINNFNKLKNNLGKLQVLVLLKKLKKSKDCDSVVKSLLGALNNKFESVNHILESDLVQQGGSNDKYYTKYLKYKMKYLYLKK